MSIFVLVAGLGVGLLLPVPAIAGESLAALSSRQGCPPMSTAVMDGSLSAQLAQEGCPPDFPVDCQGGGCCPADTACCDDGSCCPTGYPHHCGSRCYATLQGALDAGCSMSEISVCGVAQ